MFHEVSTDGGLGFCHAALPNLLAPGYHGPLAVDSQTPPLHGTLLWSGGEHGLPDGADRDLVLEAQAVGAQIFLTRDRRVLRQTALTGPATRICAPSDLADDLGIAGVEPMRGGTCGARGCPYRDSILPAPDMGKWGPLFEHLGDE